MFEDSDLLPRDTLVLRATAPPDAQFSLLDETGREIGCAVAEGGACPEKASAAQPRKASGPKLGFYVLFADGGITYEQGLASGQAAIGAVLKDHKHRDIEEVSQRIGWARNHHEAEYKALIEGLKLARRHGIDRIRVFLDSRLVVNTVNGDWNLKSDYNKDLCTKACVLVKEFADIKVCWVPREMNLEADTLASRALGRDV